MTNVADSVLDALLQACHKAAGRGLMRCSSGNLSLRVDDTRMLSTATRSWRADISATEVSVCRIADGVLLEGARPTVETGFHAGILRARADVNVVMHFQSPYATALACLQADAGNYFLIPEIPCYIGHVAQVPYLLPGSVELAEAVTGATRDHRVEIVPLSVQEKR